MTSVTGRHFLRSLLVGVLAVSQPVAWAEDAAPEAVLLDVTRYIVEGDNPLPEAETADVLRSHLGPQLDLAALESAAAALEARIRERGFAFHRVIVPAQKPSGGVVRLQILRFTLARVDVTGNLNFSDQNILRTLPALRPGVSPDVRELSRELGQANEHPAKRLAIVMKESKTPDAMDAEVRVQDVPAQQTFLGLVGGTRDRYNDINDNTGYTRLTIGHQRSNLFDRDHALTLAYSTSPDYLKDVSMFGAFYWIPIYAAHSSVQFFYTRSDVNSGSIGAGAANFDVSGRGEFWGGRYTYTLPKVADLTHNVSVAVEDRHFESQVILTAGGVSAGETPVVHSRPLSLRYTMRKDQPWGSIGGFAEYLTNLSGGSGNNCAAYTAARAGASCHWQALRYGVDGAYALPAGWGLTVKLRGQHTQDALISGEQFGLGGVGSVRGLRDREFTGDRGYTLSIEALGPALVDTLKPVVFYDQGRVSAKGDSTLSPPSHDTASSIGAGLRWNWRRQLDVTADLAYVLNGVQGNGSIPGTPAGHSKVNFSLFYRF